MDLLFGVTAIIINRSKSIPNNATKASEKLQHGLTFGLIIDQDFTSMLDCMNSPGHHNLGKSECGKYFPVLFDTQFMMSLKIAGFDSIRLSVDSTKPGAATRQGCRKWSASLVGRAIGAKLKVILDVQSVTWTNNTYYTDVE